jgi:hypothetical protein
LDWDTALWEGACCRVRWLNERAAEGLRPARTISGGVS